MRILGVDYGERRIGLAVSDPSGMLARPWRVLQHAGSVAKAAQMLARVVETLGQQEDGLGAIVIGLPTRLDGSPHEQTARVRTLAQALARHTGVPIRFQDERLTSREAESRLALRERDWRRRKAKLDAAAAAVMLQDHLDQQADAPVPLSGERR